MPIPIAPIEIPVEQVVQTTVTADKLHIIGLSIKDPTKVRPSLELQGVPYAEDEQGNKQFGSQIFTLQTVDVYAAIANLKAAGLNKMEEAMMVIFEAAAEMMQYRAARQADVEAAQAEKAAAQAVLDKAIVDNKGVNEANAALQDANVKVMSAFAAMSDPANPPLK